VLDEVKEQACQTGADKKANTRGGSTLQVGDLRLLEDCGERGGALVSNEVALEIERLQRRVALETLCNRGYSFGIEPVILKAHASPLCSVGYRALQIKELKGTKRTETIDLSDMGLGVAFTIIIASCIKGNGVLKELKCAPPHSVRFRVSVR
jgi:hypothetical protein